MNIKGLPSFTDDYTQNAREMVTQTCRWAVTLRDMTLGPWQGMFSHSKALQDATSPWFDVITTTHNQWLQLWQAQANATLDSASIFTHQPRA